MAKKNKIKRKTTGFDIMYRVVTALLVVAMFPAFYFSNLLHYEIDHSTVSSILSLITGQQDSGGTQGDFGLYELTADKPGLLATLIKSSLNSEAGADLSALNPVYKPVVAAAVLIAAALLVGLVILGFAVFSNKSKVIAALSGGGLLLTIASYISFNSYFAKPLLNGEISFAQLANSEESLLYSIVGMVAKINVLRLDTAFFAVLFLMAAVLLWSLAVIIVNAGDENKPKKIKK